MSELVSLIENEDISIYRVPSESTEGDRVSLLMVQNAIKERSKEYKYLEVGSHLGGMLIPHLCDPCCTRVLSVDKRPLSQYDARGRSFDYIENSTARMINTIREAFPGLSIDKLLTVDSDISEISDQSIFERFDLLMIDAEHTNIAAVSDFLSLIKFGHSDSVFLFHDANLVYEAILICEKFLSYLNINHATLFLDDNVAVIMLGSSRDLVPQLARRTQDRRRYINASRRYLNAQVAANHSE